MLEGRQTTARRCRSGFEFYCQGPLKSHQTACHQSLHGVMCETNCIFPRMRKMIERPAIASYRLIWQVPKNRLQGV
jgi:hypothetical protein